MSETQFSVFFSISAFIFSAISCIYVGRPDISSIDVLSIVALIIGSVALTATVVMVLFSLNIFQVRQEIKELHTQAQSKLEEIRSIESQQRQLLDSFVLTSRFANEMANAVSDDVEVVGNSVQIIEGEAELVRRRLAPIRLLMQALHLPDREDRLDACRDATGALEGLGALADPAVCKFAAEFFERLPVLSRLIDQPLENQHMVRIEVFQTRLRAVRVLSEARVASYATVVGS